MRLKRPPLLAFDRIGFGIFVDVVPFAAAVDGGTFQSKFQRVAIHLLEQRAAHAVAPDILGPAFASELRGNVLNGVEIHAVALNETDVGNGGLPAFFVYFVAEDFRDDFEKLFEHGDGIAGVRANYQRAFTLKDFVAERAAPEIAHGVVDVVRVADAGDDAFGAVFQHVGVRLAFVGFAPGGDGGVFGGGDAVAGAVERIGCREVCGIKLIEELNGGQRVRAEKIQQMSGAADGRGFFGGNAAETEVVQFEREQRGIAGADKRPADDLLDGAGKRGDGDGIPHLQENGFRPVGEPVEFRVGVLDGDERVEALDDGAFLDGANAQRQAPAMFRVKDLKPS